MSLIILKEKAEDALPLKIDIDKILILHDPVQLAERNKLIAQMDDIEEIDNPQASEIAFGLITKSKELSNQADEDTSSVKRPVDKFGKRLLTSRDEFKTKLTDSTARVVKMNNIFATAQAKRVAEEKEKADTTAREAETQRQSLLEKASTSTDAVEISRVNQQVQKLEEVQGKALTIMEAPREKPAGARERTEYPFEVLDVHALYAYDKSLVKVEASQTAVKDFVKRNYDDIRSGKLEVPGLRVDEKTVNQY